MRALANGETVCVRNPLATRPWQHVLEPLGGYLRLAMCLAETEVQEGLSNRCSGFNFGPDPAANRPVTDLVEQVLKCWPGVWDDQSAPGTLHEAGLLNLSIDKAERLLDWSPLWGFEAAIDRTVEWYRCAYDNPESICELTHRQIAEYMELFDPYF